MAYIQSLTSQIKVYDDTVNPTQTVFYNKADVSVRQVAYIVEVVSTINNSVLHDIPFSKITAPDGCGAVGVGITEYVNDLNEDIQDVPPVPGQVSGEGIQDYVARWDSTNRFLLTTGLFRDNGTTQSIRNAPDPNIQFYTYAPEVQTGHYVEVIGSTNGTNTGVKAIALNGQQQNIGVYGEGGGTIGTATADDTHYGVVGYALRNGTGESIGVLGYADGTTSDRTVGGFFYAENNGGGTAYGVRIVDGTETAGYVLTSDADGYASWQPAGGGGTGDITDGDNLGTGQGEVFAQKNGTILEFRSLREGANIAMTQSGIEIEIAVSGLATVATSGDYNDLINTPTLVSAFTGTKTNLWRSTCFGHKLPKSIFFL